MDLLTMERIYFVATMAFVSFWSLELIPIGTMGNCLLIFALQILVALLLILMILLRGRPSACYMILDSNATLLSAPPPYQHARPSRYTLDLPPRAAVGLVVGHV